MPCRVAQGGWLEVWLLVIGLALAAQVRLRGQLY